jgi:polar amino acid transport system substrate-binding protein
MKNKFFIILVLVTVIATFSFVSCIKTGTTDTSKLKTIKSGVLTVGSDTTWKPMEYIEGDKIVGFDVDLTQAIADKLGLKLDYQSTAWDGLFPALIAHKFDMAISSITITDERKKEMDFSDSYFKTDQAVAMLAGTGIDAAEKLNGKKAGVQIGTTGELEAKKISGLTVNTYDDIMMAFEDLKAGRIDVVIADSYLVYAYAKLNAEFEVGFDIVTNEQLGMAFAKDTPDLVKAVNSALKTVKDNLIYDKIYVKWFGTHAIAE